MTTTSESDVGGDEIDRAEIASEVPSYGGRRADTGVLSGVFRIENFVSSLIAPFF
jgi:hypothetical protein